MKTNHSARMRWLWLFGLGLVGCHGAGPDHMPTEQERVDMMSLMLPEKLQVQPFTQVKSFDDDDVPDGILAVVRPVDRLGDPVKAVGFFYFELWTYQPASSDRKGERIAFWDRDIATLEEIRLYWTRAQMYEFQLAWTQGVSELRPNAKYLFIASYRTPWDTTIQDEYVIDFQLPAGVLTRQGGS